jgi:putative spermidine/putrescine transport system ATP-binding protein
MPEGAHTIEAEVVEFIYMGDLYRTRLRVAGSDDFVIKSRNTLTQRRLQPGERIKIGWAPQDARALDA